MPQIIKTGGNASANIVKQLGDISEYFVVSMLDASPDCISIIERDGALVFMNHNGQAGMEIDDFSMIAGEPWLNLWPDEAQYELDEALELAKDGFSSRLEAFCPTNKGTPRWWDITVSPIYDNDREVVRLLTISRDISAQIERQDRINRYDLQLKELNDAQARTIEAKEELLAKKDVLMREIDHRVKNSLAMITSMMRMQAVREDDPVVLEKLNAAANRVMSVGKVHERLYKGDDVTRVDLSAYLPPLCEEMVLAMGNKNVGITTDIDPVEVPSEKAIAIGLMTSELVGNAIKHAFPDGKGVIEVTTKSVYANRLELVIDDDGLGLPCDFDLSQSSGLGMKIISLYLKSLNAEIDCRNNAKGGAQFMLSVPL